MEKMKYTFGKRHWRNPDSKYGYGDPMQLDKDVMDSIMKSRKRGNEIKEILVAEINKDPARQRETYELIIKSLIEIKTELKL
ncbi:hypothetical protein [Weizmannia acidilactici]|uniref:hypothetical protein n=1 Tax=Weizmannia acidilactici TaxID=2607726 RepID=UPI00124DB7E8|nr:hypothetical protein [Weizmannia acidilactici]GER73414.1 hypothetical protein BpPP18_14810 [Weizmannia acidilactici]